MSEIKKIIRQCVSDFNYLANRQIGVLESNDEDLGFIPWGGKDAEGNITVFLSKDKPGILSTLKITEIADGNAGIIQYDSEGQLSGLADLNLLADVEITDPSNLQGLIYNSDNSKWENQDIITYGLTYKGTWNADTNNPELSDAGGGGVKGDLYIVNVEGTTEIDGISDWKVKDWIVNCGDSWEKVDNTEIVYTFDLVYDNESGEHLITIDDGSMRWAIDGDYDFNIDLTDAEASRGFKVYDASNSFQIIKEPLSSLYLIGNLYNVQIDSSNGSLYQSTASPLQIRTLTSGDISITSAGIIDIDAISNIDIDGTGYFDVQVTGIVSIDGSGNSNFSTWDGNLTISTMSTGSLILTSIALVDLNAGANLDIDVTGTFDMLSTGAFSIDGTGASNVSATSGNLTISTITSGTLILLSAGVVDIDGSDITIDGTAGLSIDVATASNITVSGATADLTLGARGATITLNQSGNTSLSGFTATSIIGALNEVKTASYSSSYACMYLNANSTVTTNETANTPILTRHWTTGSLSGWTYVAGITGSITAYSNYGGTVAGTVRAASTAHGLTTGDYISIRGTTNYNGVFQITKISNDAFYFYDTWVSDDGASDWDRGSYLLAGANAAGTYKASYTISSDITIFITSNVYYYIYVNATRQSKTISMKYHNANAETNISVGEDYITIAVGDRVSLAVECSNAAANPTNRYGTVTLNRI